MEINHPFLEAEGVTTRETLNKGGIIEPKYFGTGWGDVPRPNVS